MKIKAIFLFSLLLGNLLNAQNDKLSSRLMEEMGKEGIKHIKIGIQFEKKANLDSLESWFKEADIPANKRPYHVIQTLQKVSDNSQKELKKWINSLPQGLVSSTHSFWIVNRMILEIDPQLVNPIASFKAVRSLDLETLEIDPLEPVLEGTTGSAHSFSGVEPGLDAINARPLWKMGYSGRGKLAYNFDTGVWADHPAFTNRFLGNRFPMKQSWLGYYRDFPNGLIHDHGTHTLGTILGLDPSSTDTVGVAFGAYWIANDYVGTTVESLPPIEDMIYGFEWALNPDGDIQTSNDVPDVINNSWRWSDDPTTEHCEGYIVDLMNAIEAAGIANVFSGGNAGPDNVTVSSPQRINTSVVNTFSVGSVNGNVSAPYPISDFSTRGPTQCDGTGSLKIHPQVVAPGENVRSSWGHNSYNSISGTSMAAPHVSGAVLLLKEAFPDLSGEELLWALYETALDYGETGEDNTYGNGMIDVYDAFLFLSSMYEPKDPGKVDYDLAIDRLSGISEGQIVCSNAIAPSLMISNRGDSTIIGFILTYWLSNIPDTFQIQRDLSIIPGQSIELVLEEIWLNENQNLQELFFIIESKDSTVQDYDLFNNQYRVSFVRRDPVQLPVYEDFEQGINDSIWFIDNPDYSITWDTFPTSGLPDSHYSGTVQFYKYSPRNGQKDELILSNVLLPEDKPTAISFDWSYQPFFNAENIRDTLRILIRENCNKAEQTVLMVKAGESLIVNDSIAINFKPKFPWQWDRDTVLVTDFMGKAVSIVFEATNMKWNNLYIDNIQIEELDETSMGENVMDPVFSFQIFPNPTNGSFSLQLSGIEFNEPVEIEIADILGRSLYTEKWIGNWKEFKLNQLENGPYVCILKSGTERRYQMIQILKNR